MTSSQQFCLRWNNHPTNLLTVFEHLLQTEAFVDVTLAVEGIAVKAHKMVLSACSPYFESLFMGNPDKHPIVFLKDVKYSEIKALLDFMYRGEVSVDQENLTCLLKVAESLRIKGLTEVREKKVGDSTKLSPILPLNTSNCNSEPPMKRVALSTSPTPLNPLVGAQKRKRGRPRTLSPSPRSLSSPGPDSAVNNIDNVSAVNSTSHESESLEEMEHVEGCVEPDEIESNQRNNYEYREDDSHGSSSPLQDDDEKWSGKESESFGKENDEVHIKVEPESPLESSQSERTVKVKGCALPLSEQQSSHLHNALATHSTAASTFDKYFSIYGYDTSSSSICDADEMESWESLQTVSNLKYQLLMNGSNNLGSPGTLSNMLSPGNNNNTSNKNHNEKSESSGSTVTRFSTLQDGTYTCNLCHTTFTHPSNFHRHYITRHQKQRSFPCPVCSKPFNRRDNMTNHLRTVHKKAGQTDDKLADKSLDLSIVKSENLISEKSDLLKLNQKN